MLINGYIAVVIFIVIVIIVVIVIIIVIVIAIIRIIPTNPKPLCDVYAFTFILENRD